MPSCIQLIPGPTPMHNPWNFQSDQYKEIDENNRMGKTRDLLKKIRDAKGNFMQRWAQ